MYITHILWKPNTLHDIRASLKSLYSDGHKMTCFHRNLSLVTLLTKAHQWTLYSGSSVQYTSRCSISVRSIKIISSHTWQDFFKQPLPLMFPTTTAYTVRLSHLYTFTKYYYHWIACIWHISRQSGKTE